MIDIEEGDKESLFFIVDNLNESNIMVRFLLRGI